MISRWEWGHEIKFTVKNYVLEDLMENNWLILTNHNIGDIWKILNNQVFPVSENNSSNFTNKIFNRIFYKLKWRIFRDDFQVIYLDHYNMEKRMTKPNWRVIFPTSSPEYTNTSGGEILLKIIKMSSSPLVRLMPSFCE